MKPTLKKFLQTWLISSFAVLVTVTVLHKHFHCEPRWMVFFVALLLGVLNVYLRPLMMVLALPLVIYTLGLFLIVINGCLIYIVDWLLGKNFDVDGFGWAMLGSLMIGLISLILNIVTGNLNSPIKVVRHKRDADQKSDGDDGNGPVIDV
jgi:putative membrane protein